MQDGVFRKGKSPLSERLGWAHGDMDWIFGSMAPKIPAVGVIGNLFDEIQELEEDVKGELKRCKRAIHEFGDDPEQELSLREVESVIAQKPNRIRENVCYYAGCISMLTLVAHSLGIDTSEYDDYEKLLESDAYEETGIC